MYFCLMVISLDAVVHSSMQAGNGKQGIIYITRHGAKVMLLSNSSHTEGQCHSIRVLCLILYYALELTDAELW